MRIGLLADIHEDVERLSAAITCCRRAGADRLLTLGDIYQFGERFAETVGLLRQADVAGVWGNHEIGLCHQPGDWTERQFDRVVLDYMGRLQPRMEVEDALLGHFLPGLDPTDVGQPWYLEDVPETAEAAAPHFAAFPHRRMFVAHYHRWRIVTPEGALAWSGEGPFAFDRARRYLVVVAAVCDGWCAVYDTEADLLTPYDVRSSALVGDPD